MILRALVEYYDRKATDPATSLPPEGFELKEIPFVIVLDSEGHFVQFEDMRDVGNKMKRARAQLVPHAIKKAAGIAANLLWDPPGYVLGVGADEDRHRTQLQHEAFLERLRGAFDGQWSDEGTQAVRAFCEAPPLDRVFADPLWPVIRETKPFLSFRLVGEHHLVCQRPAVQARIAHLAVSEGNDLCLVTGQRDALARLHPSIKGVRGAQSSGASVVSFNLDAFRSFGKEQGANAPIGERATFAYTTALNALLGKDSKQRLQVGDTTMVFWAGRTSGAVVEDAYALWWDLPRDDPDAGVKRVESLYRLQRGEPLTDDDTQPFYVLGLAPNAARLSVRFWHVDTIRALGAHVWKHFDDLRIDRAPALPEFPTLFSLLRAVAPLEDVSRLPPVLTGEWMRAILSGRPYPLALLQGALRRAQAEHEIDYFRAAIIKAATNRRTQDEQEKLTVSLDPTNTNVGYRLGRLFAVLERVQREAQGDTNATIVDRYFGGASTAPRTVFPILTRLQNHHLAKLDNRGRAENLRRLTADVMSELDASDPFPAHLSLLDQGRFAVGYYHQRHHSSTYKTEGAQS